MDSRRYDRVFQPRVLARHPGFILTFVALFLILPACKTLPEPAPASPEFADARSTQTPTRLAPSRTPPARQGAAPTTEFVYPPPPPTPYHHMYPYPVPSQPPPEVTVVVRHTQPPGAVSQQGTWSIPRSCGAALLAKTSSLADGSLDLKLSGDPESSWAWSSQPQASQYQWHEIKPLLQGRLYNILAFFGLESDGQWSLVVVNDLCSSAQLAAILSVSDPEQAYLEIFSDLGASSDVYWLLDGNTLTAYRLVDEEPIPVFTLDDAPAASFIFWGNYLTDLNTDGVPEFFLRWGELENPIADQILIQEGDGYMLIGEIEPGLQFSNLDGEGWGEFLRAKPKESPTQWDVYQLKGDRFEQGDSLPRPGAVQPFYPSETNLPRLPTDLYFMQDGGWWVWPNTGGAIEALSQTPSQKGQSCRQGITDREVVSWSPDCRYAVLYVPGSVEGGANVLLDAQNGREISIPGTFTYARGLSTFAWDPGSRYLVHAQADGGEGIYRISLPGGVAESLMLMNIPVGVDSQAYSFGGVDPVVLPDGAIGFAVVGFQSHLYPPPGIYLLDREHHLQMLAELPSIAHDPQDFERAYPGRVFWSPDGSMFLYTAPTIEGYMPPYQVILLGRSDGTAVWDLTRILSDARDFQWRGAP